MPPRNFDFENIIWGISNETEHEHPSYYNQGDIECIDAIRESMSFDEFNGFCKGNCIKYLWRYNDKGGKEDLKKARVYLDWMINNESTTAKKEEQTNNVQPVTG